LETTDLHVHVLPYDYYADRPTDTAGLSRTAILIKSARAEAKNSLLVDNGDLLQGTPLGDYAAYERGLKDGDTHPIIHAMNHIGFEASTLGNHEFNYGLDFLMKSLAGAHFPVVSANVITKRTQNARTDTTLIKPYVILERNIQDGTGETHPIKIGIIGFTPPQVMTWDRQNLEGKVETRDIVNTARDYIPQMKEDGADIILALNHSGIGSAKHTEGMENASVPLAALDGIDAIVTGHSHLVFPSPTFAGLEAVDAEKGLIHGKPATMAGLWGSHLGVIDLLLERDGREWRVITSSVEARPIAHRTEDDQVVPLVYDCKDVLEATAHSHRETLNYIRRPVGKTDTALTSYFSLIADDPSIHLIADAQKWYLRDMFKKTAHADLPILAAVSPARSGGRAGPNFYTDVPAGDIAIKNVADLYLFPNAIRAVRINGSQIKNWLERSAGLFLEIAPGVKDQHLLNSAFPSYYFDIICGITYEIDVSQPSRFTETGDAKAPRASRIVKLEYEGRPITDDMEFIVATNSYRANGGGRFPGADGSTLIFEGPDTIRDILVRYITEHGTVTPKPQDTWRFKSQPDTTALFQTNAKAVPHIQALTNVKIEPTGMAKLGLAEFRITF
jgi:2',3'-cyclic-nucleotide 2'-phosphodiesterase/3'-nucleotidase